MESIEKNDRIYHQCEHKKPLPGMIAAVDDKLKDKYIKMSDMKKK